MPLPGEAGMSRPRQIATFAARGCCRKTPASSMMGTLEQHRTLQERHKARNIGAFSNRRTLTSALLAVGATVICGAPGYMSPRTAKACTTCEVGDRTEAAMGAEAPYKNRLRGGVQFRFRTDAVGERGRDQIRLREQRLHASLAWAPSDRWMLSVMLPVSRRALRHVNLARHENTGMGDVDLRMRAVLFRDRRFETRHMLTAGAGLELPTARLRRSAQGESLPLEVQAGSASWDPHVDLAYRFAAHPFSMSLSSSLLLSTQGPTGARAGPALLSNIRLQYEPSSWLALRAGLSGRASGPTRESFGIDPNSGGAIVYTSLGLAVPIHRKARIMAEALLPTLNALRGAHREGPVWVVGAYGDFR